MSRKKAIRVTIHKRKHNKYINFLHPAILQRSIGSKVMIISPGIAKNSKGGICRPLLADLAEEPKSKLSAVFFLADSKALLYISIPPASYPTKVSNPGPTAPSLRITIASVIASLIGFTYSETTLSFSLKAPKIVELLSVGIKNVS